MKIDLQAQELVLIIGVLEHSDPTGFYCKQLVDKLRDRGLEEQKKEMSKAKKVEEK